MARRSKPLPTEPQDERLGNVRHGFAPTDGAKTAAADAPPLADIAAQLVEDIKATAAAETALIKARAALAGDGVRRAAMWGAIAGGALLIALLTVVFGLVLFLAPYTGAVLATILVGGALTLFAALAAWGARNGVADVKIALGERGDTVHWDEET